MLKDGISVLVRMRVGGWLEQLGMNLISTQVVVEVEVGVELGNTIHQLPTDHYYTC